MRPAVRQVLLNRPFSPRDLFAVKYWLDAGSIVGVADGAAISTSNWSDKSKFARGVLAAAVDVTYRATGASTGRAAAEFNGTTSYLRSGSFAVAQPLRVFMVAKQIAWASGRRFIDGVSVNMAVINQNSLTPKLGLFAGSSIGPLDDTMQLGNWSLIDVVFNNASSSLQVDGNTAGTGTAGTNGYTDGITLGTAGNLNASFFCNYSLAELVIADSTLTATQAAQIKAYLNKKHGLATQSVLVVDGDSLTAGQGVSAGQDYPSVLQGLLGGQRSYRLSNGGVAGETLANMQADASSTVDGQLRNYAKATLIAWGGTNDLKVDDVSLATLQSRWNTYASARQSAGWTAANNRRFVAVTLIERGNWSSDQRTRAADFNTWLRANYSTYCTHLLDLAADSRFQNSADATYFNVDGVHLTVVGYALVAALAQPLVA